MERVQASSRSLADRLRTQIAGLWALVEAGDLTVARFRRAAAAAVARANVQGVALADLGIAAEVTRQLRRPTPPLGLMPTGVQIDQDRMLADIDRRLDLEHPGGSLADWARSEPLLTVAATTQRAMRERNASGWTRMLSGASCPLCVGWADGKSRPVSVQMIRHPGCDCIPAPTF